MNSKLTLCLGLLVIGFSQPVLAAGGDMDRNGSNAHTTEGAQNHAACNNCGGSSGSNGGGTQTASASGGIVFTYNGKKIKLDKKGNPTTSSVQTGRESKA